MLEPYQKKIIEYMYSQEILLAKLYKLFSEQFPDYREFWEDLAKDELRHGELIKQFYKATKKDLVTFCEGKIKTYTMKTFLDSIEKIIERTQNGELNVKMAMTYTYDFERSLIEKNVFSRFKILDKKLSGIIDKLEKETNKHCQKAKNLVDKIRVSEV